MYTHICIYDFHPSLSFINACKCAFSPPQSCVTFVLQLGCCWLLGCRCVSCSAHRTEEPSILGNCTVGLFPCYTRYRELYPADWSWWQSLHLVMPMLLCNHSHFHEFRSPSLTCFTFCASFARSRITLPIWPQNMCFDARTGSVATTQHTQVWLQRWSQSVPTGMYNCTSSLYCHIDTPSPDQTPHTRTQALFVSSLDCTIHRTSLSKKKKKRISTNWWKILISAELTCPNG